MEMRTVEYYRLWDGGTWDTDSIEIPKDTPEERIEEAVREAAAKIKWREDVPVIVGVYCASEEEEN